MTIQETVYLFKLKFDKLDTQKRFNLSLPQIIIFLNKSQDEIVLKKYGRNNSKRAGFEETHKRVQDLQRLVIKCEDNLSRVYPVTSITDKIFKFDTSTNLNKYLFTVRCFSYCTKGECEDISVDCIESYHNDLSSILRDPHNSPSFEWREIPIVYAEDQIYLYSDGTFTIDKICIDYIRYPINMDIAGYTHFDSTASADVDCELPEFVQYEIVDQAVLECFKVLENQLGSQETRETTINDEE